jgi:hypothetical protein
VGGVKSSRAVGLRQPPAELPIEDLAGGAWGISPRAQEAHIVAMLALLTERAVVKEILEHLGLRATGQPKGQHPGSLLSGHTPDTLGTAPCLIGLTQPR